MTTKDRILALGAVALLAAVAGAGACSKSDSKASVPDGIGGAGGGAGAGGGGGSAGAGASGGGAAGQDAGGDVEPNDAARIEDASLDADAHSPTDATIDIVYDDVPDVAVEAPECVLDVQCEGKVSVGPCEVARCTNNACTKAPAADLQTCDDGDACTTSSVCTGGACVGVAWDTQSPSCVAPLGPGSVWFTEVMGNPVAIGPVSDGGKPPPSDGGKPPPKVSEWIELVNNEGKAVSLQGAFLVEYEWASGDPEPANPTLSTKSIDMTSLVSPGAFVVGVPSFLASSFGDFAYGPIALGDDVNIKLMLVRSTWNQTLPIPTGDVIDAITIDAGTFSAAKGGAGASWQLGMPFPSSDAGDSRVFCRTPADPANAYVTDPNDSSIADYGTPGKANVACP